MSKKISFLSSNFTPYHFNELITLGLSIDCAYCLELISQDIDMEFFFKDNVIGLSYVQSLTRKGYIKNGQLTEEGIKLLEWLRVPPDKKLSLKRRVSISNEDFDRFWLSYPATDNVIMDGKILYTGTRAMRKGKKTELQLKLSKILSEGRYSLDEIIAAVRFEVQQKINESVKNKENKLKYMQNIETYINQRSFEAYIDVAKLSTHYQKKEQTFITDI